MTTRATAKLVIYPAAFMALGSQHVETARRFSGRFQLADGLADFCFFRGIGIISQLVCNSHFRVTAEFNIRASTRHIGGDRDGTRHTGLRDNGSFLLVITGVENGKDSFSIRTLVTVIKRLKGVHVRRVLELKALFNQKLREVLGFFNRSRTNKDRLTFGASFLDLNDYRFVFFASCAVNFIVHIFASDGNISRNFNDFETVDFSKLFRFRQGCTGHA